MKPNSEVNLTLTHEIPSYDTILWYQRSPGHTSLKLIGYVYYKTPKVESQFQSHCKVSGDGEKTAYLQILNLRHPEDSGEYFGAASRVSAVTFQQSPPQIMKESSKVNIDCSHDDGSLYLMLWYQQTKDSLSMTLIGYGVNNYDPAYFGSGTRLTVLERDPILPQVKVLKPSAKECRNKKKTLVCVASKFYPDHVSVYWKIDGENPTDGVVTDNNALKKKDGSYTITSRLRVAAEDWFTPKKNFTCIVSFYDGKETEDYPDSVFGIDERYLRLTNAAKLSYGVFIAKSCIYGAFVAFLVWKLQGSTGKQSN
ncbi:T-cell receptor beta-1 chain C region [Collichthys lucidus]|nr:T-cell receptor beta-1 chain C region [Collichthys lucidus]